MSALALLGQAAAPDMPMQEKMRTFGRANALNRLADQSERTMMKRRSCHNAMLNADQPAPSDYAATVPEPVLPDRGAPIPSGPSPVLDDAAVAEAMGVFASCNRVRTAPAEHSVTKPQPAPPGNVAKPPPAVIHYTGAAPGNGPISHRFELLQRSAMQTVAVMRQPYFRVQTAP